MGNVKVVLQSSVPTFDMIVGSNTNVKPVPHFDFVTGKLAEPVRVKIVLGEVDKPRITCKTGENITVVSSN